MTIKAQQNNAFLSMCSGKPFRFTNQENTTVSCIAAKLRFWGGMWQRHGVGRRVGAVVRVSDTLKWLYALGLTGLQRAKVYMIQVSFIWTSHSLRAKWNMTQPGKLSNWWQPNPSQRDYPQLWAWAKLRCQPNQDNMWHYRQLLSIQWERGVNMDEIMEWSRVGLGGLQGLRCHNE